MISQSCRIQRKPAHTLAAREALGNHAERVQGRGAPAPGACDEMSCSCEHNALPRGPLSHGRRCERVMLMGSTQGASLIFAHYGAFYGATGGPRRPRCSTTSYSRILDQSLLCKDKSHDYICMSPTCLPTTPASRSDAHQALSDAPHTTPQHSYDLRYTSPYSLFRDVDASNVHCS